LVTVNGARGADEATPDPRHRIKVVARRLFADRGIRDVTIREIAREAGQKNVGVVGYYFGNKEGLVAEILVDAARLIEARRNAHLDRLEAEGGPRTVREAVEALVLPSVQFGADDAEHGEGFNRFLLHLSQSDPGFIDRTLEGRWNVGYQRCLTHMRRLMPDMPPTAKNRRFVFVGAYVSALLAVREAMMDDPARGHPGWGSDATLQDIVQTTTAILDAPARGADKSG
jgi:AcrR family transcriptional regulator